jgi:hypothetical protein
MSALARGLAPASYTTTWGTTWARASRVRGRTSCASPSGPLASVTCPNAAVYRAAAREPAFGAITSQPRVGPAVMRMKLLRCPKDLGQGRSVCVVRNSVNRAVDHSRHEAPMLKPLDLRQCEWLNSAPAPRRDIRRLCPDFPNERDAEQERERRISILEVGRSRSCAEPGWTSLNPSEGEPKTLT